MDDYLKRLRLAFEEDDIEAFNELKEDLLEQLAVCLEEGQTEAEVVAGLASPEEIAADYFADRSLDAAMNAKTYVVPKEDVQDVFIKTQKRRLKKIWQAAFRVIKPLMFIVLMGIFLFFVTYVVKELSEDKHLAAIPLTASLLLAAVLLQFVQSWRSVRRRWVTCSSLLLFISAVTAVIYFAAVNQLFYTGRSYYQKIELTSADNASFSFHSDADVEITTVEVASTEQLSFIVRGRFKESDIQKIESGNYENKVDLSLDQEDIFDIFTKTGRSQLIFFIPKGVILDDFYLDLAQGDLRLVDIETKKFDLNMLTGDVYAKNIIAETGRIYSESGDVVIEESAIDLAVESLEGKMVITGLLGDLSIDVKDGLSILKMLHSEKVTVMNHSSRMILEDSVIQSLKAEGESGQLVVKRTEGDLTISNKEGKIVSEENKGQLLLENGAGPTIVIQSVPVEAEVSSKSGFIKWLQEPDQSMQIEAVTQNGELRNEFSEIVGTEQKAVIRSESGDIKVLRKIE